VTARRGGSEITRAQEGKQEEEDERRNLLVMALPVFRLREGNGCLLILAAFGHRILHGPLERIFRKPLFSSGQQKPAIAGTKGEGKGGKVDERQCEARLAEFFVLPVRTRQCEGEDSPAEAGRLIFQRKTVVLLHFFLLLILDSCPSNE